jgi:hypothetical protein
MPPYSFGTNGPSPCARAFFRSGPSIGERLGVEFFSAGMHSSCTHLRTFSRIALASAGISKSIDIWFPRFLLLLVRLEDGINLRHASGNTNKV